MIFVTNMSSDGAGRRSHVRSGQDQGTWTCFGKSWAGMSDSDCPAQPRGAGNRPADCGGMMLNIFPTSLLKKGCLFTSSFNEAISRIRYSLNIFQTGLNIRIIFFRLG